MYPQQIYYHPCIQGLYHDKSIFLELNLGHANYILNDFLNFLLTLFFNTILRIFLSILFSFYNNVWLCSQQSPLNNLYNLHTLKLKSFKDEQSLCKIS